MYNHTCMYICTVKCDTHLLWHGLQEDLRHLSLPQVLQDLGQRDTSHTDDHTDTHGAAFIEDVQALQNYSRLCTS